MRFLHKGKASSHKESTGRAKDMTKGNPTGLIFSFALPLILGNQKGIDGTTCSAAIILTTILCVFTIPVLMAVAG